MARHEYWILKNNTLPNPDRFQTPANSSLEKKRIMYNISETFDKVLIKSQKLQIITASTYCHFQTRFYKRTDCEKMVVGRGNRGNRVKINTFSCDHIKEFISI